MYCSNKRTFILYHILHNMSKHIKNMPITKIRVLTLVQTNIKTPILKFKIFNIFYQ